MRYLVTGGCGFIGSHLVDALIGRGDQVIVLDDLSTGQLKNLNGEATFLEGSILDQALVRRVVGEVDACFHLAAVASVALSEKDWIGSHEINQTGLVVLLDAVRRAGKPLPVVYASSAAVYGRQLRMPIRESARLRPTSVYGADKLCCELQASTASRTAGIPTLGLRFFNVYGPRQDPASPYSGVISIFAKMVLEGRSLNVFGDGRQTRDFVYVGDVVAALLASVGRADSRARVLNVSTGRGTTIHQLAQLIMDLEDRRVPVAFGAAREGDIRHSVGSPALSVAELGIRSETMLADGLRRTLAWLRTSEND